MSDDKTKAVAATAVAVGLAAYGAAQSARAAGQAAGQAAAAAPPSGAAGGDLAGLYPNPSVASIGGGAMTSVAVVAQIPTVGQKAALPGTSGAPSALNPYVTDADARNTNARFPLTTVIPGVAAHDSGMVWVESAAGLVARRVLWNISAAVDPTSAADSTLGYSFHSYWFNTAGQRTWKCESAAAGAAVWTLQSAGSPGLAGILANFALMGPVSGAPGNPTYRAISQQDIPNLILRNYDDGVAAPGPIAFPGALAGDVLIDVLGWVNATNVGLGDEMANFEPIITVNGQIQQVAGGDLSVNRYRWLLQRKS